MLQAGISKSQFDNHLPGESGRFHDRLKAIEHILWGRECRVKQEPVQND